jgi:hypothetical protein
MPLIEQIDACLEPGANRAPSRAAVEIDRIMQLERAAAQARVRQMDRDRRHKELLNTLATYWPFAVGVILAFFSPALRDLVVVWQPWGMWIAFPFVVLAGRPELHLTNQMSIQLQHLLVYAQFPLEGLIARWAMKSCVSVPRVAGHLCFLHFLGAVDLWLLSGVLNQLSFH